MTEHFTPPRNAHLYDRWEDQVALEKTMLETGKARMQSRIDRATEKHDMTRIRPHRTLLQEWVEPVAKASLTTAI